MIKEQRKKHPSYNLEHFPLLVFVSMNTYFYKIKISMQKKIQIAKSEMEIFLVQL